MKDSASVSVKIKFLLRLSRKVRYPPTQSYY